MKTPHFNSRPSLIILLTCLATNAAHGQDVAIPATLPGRHVLYLGPIADRDESGRLWNTGVFQLDGQKRYTIVVGSGDFEPCVLLMVSGGTVVAKGQAAASIDSASKHARVIEFAIERTGLYSVCVGSQRQGGAGAYVFEVWQGQLDERPNWSKRPPSADLVSSP